MRRHRDVDPGWDEFWTWRRVLWWNLHDVINTFAKHTDWRPLWRLNSWAARHWTEDYVAWRVRESEEGRTWPRRGPHR